MISEAISIFNTFCNFLFEFTIEGIPIVTIIIVLLCIGWIIHSLANKEP